MPSFLFAQGASRAKDIKRIGNPYSHSLHVFRCAQGCPSSAHPYLQKLARDNRALDLVRCQVLPIAHKEAVDEVYQVPDRPVHHRSLRGHDPSGWRPTATLATEFRAELE